MDAGPVGMLPGTRETLHGLEQCGRVTGAFPVITFSRELAFAVNGVRRALTQRRFVLR